MPEHRTITKSYRFHGINLDAQDGIVEGFPAILGVWDTDGEQIPTGAFAKSITERAERIPMALDHETALGTTLELAEVGRSDLPNRIKSKYPDATGGLYAKGRVSLMPDNIAWLEREKARIARGRPSGMSFQGTAYRLAKGRTPTGSEGLVLREISLDEWGPQERKRPINPAAGITSVKSAGDVATLLDDADPDVLDLIHLVTAVKAERELIQLDTPALAMVIEKAGRVLSRVNLKSLEAAINELQRIRSAATGTSDDSESDDGKEKSKAAHAPSDLVALDIELTGRLAELLEV